MCVWLLVCVSWSADSEGGVSVTVVIYERAQLQAAQCRILFSDTDGSLCRLSGRARVCACVRVQGLQVSPGWHNQSTAGQYSPGARDHLTLASIVGALSLMNTGQVGTLCLVLEAS